MTHSYHAVDILSLLWRATWQSAVLLLIVFLVIRLTHRWMPAKYRVYLWALPLCRLLLLTVPTSSISLFQGFRFLSQASTFNRNTVEAGGHDMLLVTQAASTALGPVTEGPLSNAPYPIPVESISPLQLTNAPAAWSFADVMVAVWLLGIAYMAYRWLLSHIRLQRVVKSCRPLESLRQLPKESCLQQPNGFGRRVRLLVTDQDLGPATTGISRPVILMSKRLVEELDDEQLSAIICHELQHIRRWDALLLGLCRYATIIHWFNPLAFLLAFRIRQDIELAVDAKTIHTFSDEQRQSYGNLLLQLARRPANRYQLAQIAGSQSTMAARIEAIAQPQRNTRLRAAMASVLIAALLLTGLSDVATTPDRAVAQSPTAPAEGREQVYRVVGRVTDEQTGAPIAHASLQWLVESEQDPEKRGLKCTTDDQGVYQVEVPMGEVKLWFPWLKPGYWLPTKDAMVSVVTSPEKPEAVLNIAAKPAPIWHVQTIGEPGDNPIISAMEEANPAARAALLKREYVTWDESPPQAFSELDADGRGMLTQVGTSGGLFVGIVNVPAELVVEPGFDHTNVLSATRLPNSDITEMIDVNGRRATVTSATVTLSDNVPLLTFQLKSTAPLAVQELTGRVVDASGSPVAGARVGVAAGRKNQGNAVWPPSTETGFDGSFKLAVPIPKGFEQAIQFAVVVTKDGFAGRDTQYVNATSNFDRIDYGPIELSTGHSVPVLVVGASGEPIAGAVIEPQSDYALRRQATRSGADGHAVLQNLPSGLLRVSLRYGNQMASPKLFISEDDAENDEVILRLSEMAADPQSLAERPEPIRVGTVAPELQVREWSDGKVRKLADFRGKVVVLDFWGVWCSPCINAIPVMQALAEKYEPRGVVFIGIHTADGELAQINKLKNSHGWTLASGLDHGSSITDGATCNAYGIRGYPSIVILDVDGTVAFHSGTEPADREAWMSEMAELAKANGIPWPPNEQAPEAELKAAANQLMQAMASREIERVLK